MQLNDTPLNFLPHEAPHLQKVKCYGTQNQVSAADSLALARLTSLTSLNLIGFVSGDLQALQSLGLRKVSLWNCKEAGLTLFAPGPINPFSALRKVNLFEDALYLQDSCAKLMEAEPEGQQIVQQLSETASLLQNLPSLEEVHGRSQIFSGFREGFNGWKRTRICSRKPHFCSRSICLTASQTWARGENLLMWEIFSLLP